MKKEKTEFSGAKESPKKKIIYLFSVAVCIAVLVLTYFVITKGNGFTDTLDTEYLRARVTEITGHYEDVGENGEVLSSDVFFEAKIGSGAEKGTIVEASQNYSSYTPLNPREVKEGDKVVIARFAGTDNWVFIDYLRSDALLALFALFSLLILVYGRIKGLKTLLSLTLTVAAVAFVFFPAVLDGRNVSLWAVLVCLYIIVMTLVIVNGLSKMSIAASCGCIGGVLISLGLTALTDSFIKLSGNSDAHSIFLLYIGKNGIDLRSLIYASIIIGSVGAVMDVAVDISAALKEISQKIGEPTPGELFRSGLNIGRDVIGTMSNTLVLAYIGGSMGTLILYIYNNGASPLYLFNIEAIVVEILNTLVGSIGILMTLPLTAAICSVLYTHPSVRKRLRAEKKAKRALEAAKKRAKKEAAVSPDDFSDTLDGVGAFGGTEQEKDSGGKDDGNGI